MGSRSGRDFSVVLMVMMSNFLQRARQRMSDPLRLAGAYSDSPEAYFVIMSTSIKSIKS